MRFVSQIMGWLPFSSLIYYWCIIKHLKNTKVCSIEFLRTETKNMNFNPKSTELFGTGKAPLSVKFDPDRPEH